MSEGLVNIQVPSSNLVCEEQPFVRLLQPSHSRRLVPPDRLLLAQNLE